MLPLAVILQGIGHDVSGSDRSRDQGKSASKFTWIEEQGISLFPQDGSGVKAGIDAVVISTAVEDAIPDVAAAKILGIPVVKRAELLAQNFNQSKARIAIGGTSGKTTTTGMTGFLLKEAEFDPVVMNGGIFRNYADGNPFATALVGRGDVFVTESDESDGSIALYQPTIAVVHNITLDHKPLPELKALFSDFASKADCAVLNYDDAYVRELSEKAKNIISYSVRENIGADLCVRDIMMEARGIKAVVVDKAGNESASLNLQLPGMHNLSNALAAIAVGRAMGISLLRAVEILSRFTGIKRRMEFVGERGGVAVIDDFAHNPDKIAATLSALKSVQADGYLHVFFQPHGYGFLKLVWKELAETFAAHLDRGDRLYLVEPYYAGGTVDRSIGSSHVVEELARLGVQASVLEDRNQVLQSIVKTVKTGDTVVIMGARDDTLSDFASNMLTAMPA